MNVAELEALGFSVRVKPNGNLGIRPPLDDEHELRATILEHKPQLIEEIRGLEKEGPGTELEKQIPKIFGCCACRKYRDKMNRWDVDGCTERFDEIVEWLVAQAKARLTLCIFPETITRPVAERMVTKAIARADP